MTVSGLPFILPTRRGGVRRHAARHPDGRSIALRSPSEIESVRAAGAVVRAALDAASAACVAGATTAEIDEAAHEVIRAVGATPLFLGYPSPHGAPPFPAATCVSVEEEVVHGIPGPRRVAAGELVSIDCGVSLEGWCADAAVTVAVGTVDAERAALLAAVEGMLRMAIRLARPGRRWSEIAAAMQEIPLAAGYGLLVEYVGHGIGRRLHEAPEVPNSLSPALSERRDFTLRPGMVLAIEPMLTLGGSGDSPDARYPQGAAVRRLADGWTVVAADGSPAVHVEQTIAVTRSGCEILTAGEAPSITQEHRFAQGHRFNDSYVRAAACPGDRMPRRMPG